MRSLDARREIPHRDEPDGDRTAWSHAVTDLEPEGATVLVRDMVLHTDNASAGGLTTSDALINGIHSLIRRAVEGNTMSVLTDCPSREKRGRLEQDQLVIPTPAANLDVQSRLRKTVRDMADAQTADGLVPSAVPEYTSLPGAGVRLLPDPLRPGPHRLAARR
ncbi:alpha-L-rhamnosidase-related protein [Streptomyces mexicanus]|uniref:alpha-L-rhamnosidase-related protein n=1 Tax=Streptomyces mexicanus TaxID=178566 RepID=UPI0036BDC153